MPVTIFRIELSDADKTRQGLVPFTAEFKCERRRRKLLDGFFGAVLLLQQKRVSRHAFGRLLVRFQKTCIESESFGFLARGGKAVKKHAVIERRTLGLFHSRVEIAESLHGLQVVRSRGKHRLIGFDRVVELALLDVTLGAIQLFNNIHAHEGLGRFSSVKLCRRHADRTYQSKKHYILYGLNAPNRSRSSASI